MNKKTEGVCVGEVLRNLPDIRNWAGYEPDENQYAKYYRAPEVLAAAHKIIDVYWMLHSARAHLDYYSAGNLGDIVPDMSEKNVLFAKSLFCFDALMQYAICVDLSWQVVWAFYQATSMEYLLQNRYEEMSENCSYESINVLLNERVAYPSPQAGTAGEVKALINSFLNEELSVQVRQKYNYIKHRGKYFIEGLGEGDRCLMFRADGKDIPVLCRQEVDILSIFKQLILFDVQFVRYFEKLIKKMIPDDFIG